ncbi:MAG: hypothetical protein JSR62_05060 [Nitrospira sp.]|nr:hypothetical protein [Nitrospira sp.]
MSNRRLTGILFWLCATLLLHLGFSVAGEPRSSLQESPASSGASVSGQASGLQDEAGRAGSPDTQRSIRNLIPSAARDTLKAIEARHGDPLPGYVGGRTFQNRERVLPRGYYREYDVHPKVAGKNRGAERIVIDQRSGKAYYTADHYRSFIPMN